MYSSLRQGASIITKETMEFSGNVQKKAAELFVITPYTLSVSSNG